MILKYDLPRDIGASVKTMEGEKIYYSVPVDIDENGCWTDDSYLVVTTKKIYIFRDKERYDIYEIKDCENVKAEPGVGGGILTARHKGIDRVLVHFSSRHLSRYAYVARGINILISGRFEEVVSTEYEKICPVCGRAIPGTKTCPKCSKQGGFLSVFKKMAGPYKKEFGGVFLLMVMVAVTTLLNPEVQKHLINDVLEKKGSLKEAMMFLLLMFMLSVAIVIINIMKSNATAKLGARISADLRTELFMKYQKLPLEFINDRRASQQDHPGHNIYQRLHGGCVL